MDRRVKLRRTPNDGAGISAGKGTALSADSPTYTTSIAASIRTVLQTEGVEDMEQRCFDVKPALIRAGVSEVPYTELQEKIQACSQEQWAR